MGRDFARPDLEAGMRIGSTTEADVVALLGPPLARAETNSNTVATPLGPLPREQSTLTYRYVAGSQIGPRPLPVRMAVFGFRDGKLRAAYYASTFVADQRDFDIATAAALIARPGITRADLVNALGPPEGRAADPAGHYAERDAWYVFDALPYEAGARNSRVVPTKVFTADIAPDGTVIAHKLQTDGAP